jgi:hypothetical protein
MQEGASLGRGGISASLNCKKIYPRSVKATIASGKAARALELTHSKKPAS